MSSLDRCLWEASRQGDLAVACDVLSSGARADYADGHFGWTPLHNCAERGDLFLATVLLKRGAKVNSLDRAHRTPLHRAAQNGRLEMVMLLLGSGADATILDEEEQTAEEAAFHQGHMEVFGFLLNARSDSKEELTKPEQSKASKRLSKDFEKEMQASKRKETKIVEMERSLRHRIDRLMDDIAQLHLIPDNLRTKKQRGSLEKMEQKVSQLRERSSKCNHLLSTSVTKRNSLVS